ncbi:unnamed protein product, partial [Polarella glacialis]
MLVHDTLYEVVHDRVALRGAPSVKAPMLSVRQRGALLSGVPSILAGAEGPWLRLSDAWLRQENIALPKGVEAAWVLIDGKSVGLGELLRPVAPAKTVNKQQTTSIKQQATAATTKTTKTATTKTTAATTTTATATATDTLTKSSAAPPTKLTRQPPQSAKGSAAADPPPPGACRSGPLGQFLVVYAKVAVRQAPTTQ